MVAPARRAAFEALRLVSTGRADLPAALAARRDRLADDRDRALTAEIVTGTLRWRGTLDHLIATFARRAIDRIDPEVVEILRLSVYQLLHLDRVPAAAVVDDAVDLTRGAGKRSASGFVNAVLRAVSRAGDRLPLPAMPVDGPDRPEPGSPAWEAAVDYLSVTQSHPRWLAERWLSRVGFAAADRWVRFDNAPAPVTLRVNTLRTTTDDLVRQLADEGIEVDRATYAVDALVVRSGTPQRSPLAGRGLFVLQNEASQLVALFAESRPGARVLDACASPGGKTVVMADRMGGRGLLVAADRRPRRVQLLRRQLQAAGLGVIPIVQLDLLQPLPFGAVFDQVLVDAPCSGLGTIRRDPDIRWRRTEQDLAAFAERQRQMLQAAADGVAPGGCLTYATCSSEPEENEAVASAFLAARPDFSPAAPPAVPGLETVIDERGHLRTWPHRHGLEAFFAATFRRIV
ncbi:MAG: 16S rRNA (cytosine(967)-C(5))-methyltransferase RsmB [Acidobacteriota bacterium]|nr:16S rRNA (cytosine(967)-C(5))-methyltransferase RsmB [Acidobacteriota bacterium]